MKRLMIASLSILYLLEGALLWPSAVEAQILSEYTSQPNFISKTVSPNILFIVDVGDKTLQAAYGGYPLSRMTSTTTSGKLAANVNLSGTGGLDLVASSDNGVTANSATTSAPSDAFDSTKTYYGMFDPLRCYTTNSNSFIYGSAKTDVSTACGSSYWDGNFMNWLTMRKKEVAYQALVGGTPKPAQANSDGSANSLAAETTTGLNGSQNKCSNNNDPCWRYVKFVPSATLAGRVPTSLPNPTVTGAAAGRFFGSGEGTLFVNDDSGADPFDTAAAQKYNLQVDLTSEPNTIAGTGSFSDSCTVATSDPTYAGTRVCYQKSRSLGLFQKLRTDNMRVAAFFVNASSGQGDEKIVVQFDDPKLGGSGLSSLVTGLRNEHVQTHSPLSEGLYEGLCLYRNSQGACYTSNNPQAFAASVGAQGDPFYFVSNAGMVPCCKSFVLMISPGVAEADGNAPGVQIPGFSDPFSASASNIGVVTSASAGDRLDDIALWGHTHDLRSDLAGTQSVTFYAVNSMGGAAGAALLASAAKYGAFEDRDASGAPNATGQTCTYPTGSNLGTAGTTSTSSVEWDTDKDCTPDSYFDASEGGDLETMINRAIADILKKAASGTSISVLATSSTGDGSLYQAFFFPNTIEGDNEIKWTGYVQGLFIDEFGNLREDTDGDAKLVYANDYIVQSAYDTSTGDVTVSRFKDSDGDGKADSDTPFDTTTLRDLKPIWEAGKQLALKSPADRKIQTWVDTDNDGIVDAGEQIAFSSANATTLSPYLRASSTGTNTAANIVDFILGTQVAGMRDRQLSVPSGSGTLKVWKLGDPIHSTPTVVGAPKERFDVIYGDDTYGTFFKKYKNRRLVAYVGANDGMLHAFNGGFYHKGDDSTTSSVTEHGFFTKNATDNSSGAVLGDELWGFIPYQLLPHLLWLTQTDYTHVYYVDLKPKVTDVRIFNDDATHPGGWGTILIGGFGLGGSCNKCTSTTGAPTMSVTASFGGTTQTRVFYSAYFVLDITDPEQDPVLLWSFSQYDLGLTTGYPTVVRTNPATSGRTDNTNAKWYLVVGSGMTGYDGSSTQTAKIFVVNLKTGPIDAASGASLVASFSTSDANAFMGDAIGLDNNLDFRTDTAYVGDVINNGTNTQSWIGKMYRLTTHSGDTSTSAWGVASGGNRVPTVLLSTFPSDDSLKVGPVIAAPTITADDTNNIWVFFGTGRYLSTADKTNTDTQYFFGVKDPVMTNGCTETSTTNCTKHDLVNVSSVSVCVVCASGTNQVSSPDLAGVTSFSGTATSTLQGLVQSKDGWYTTLPTSGERVLNAPVILGGTVFFPSFIPTSDVCSAGGSGMLYALFYQTGSAYKASVVGTTTVGGNTNVKRSTSLGVGLSSSMAVHVGAQGSGDQGSSGQSGSQGRVSLISQASTGATSKVSASPALTSWSRVISWINQRD